MIPLKKFKLAIILIISIISVGTIGYMIIEQGNFLESLYMTILTISTVGFREVFQLTPVGKIFTIFLIISSISILAFGINIINSFIIEGKFREVSRRRRMEKKLKKLKNHYIICGTGQTAQQIIKEFKNEKVDFVVIAHIDEAIKEREKIISRDDILYLEADATDDEVLKQAMVEKAKGLIATLSTDTDNLFVILSAKNLNPDLQIVAKAIDENSLKKMHKAGANHVISPDVIGGTRMASMILRPSIVDFLDIICNSNEELSLKMEQIDIPEKSSIDNRKLKELEIPKKTGLIIVAIKKELSEKFAYNPGPDSIVNSKDILVVLGQDDQIKKLKEYIL